MRQLEGQVAMLDFLHAGAALHVALAPTALAKPDFSSTLAIQQGYHPILLQSRAARGQAVVPNDTVREGPCPACAPSPLYAMAVRRAPVCMRR
jgi:hypothetical protein